MNTGTNYHQHKKCVGYGTLVETNWRDRDRRTFM